MARISITELKREVLGEAESIQLEVAGQEFEFPGTMPAEFELEQTRINREMEKNGVTEMPTEDNWRLVEAAFGSQRYQELRAAGVPDFDLMMAGFSLIGKWMEPYRDPQMPQRMQTALGLKDLAEMAAATRAASSNGSANTGPSSRRTGNGNTGSISVVPSGANPASLPAASGHSPRGSAGKR